MESIAAIAMAFIPFLSWILLKGGVSQMVQLASSIMAPAQSAASTVAAEKTYGNYSFGNVNLDNLNGYNAQTFRQTYSGFLSSGSTSIDSGTETMTYTPRADSLYIKQSDSYLREGVSKTEAFSKAVQDSYSISQTALKESSQGFSENLTDTTNKTIGFVKVLSQQFQKGDNYNTQSATGLQEAVQFIKGTGDDYAKAQGISNDQAMREVISSGLGFSFGIKAGIDGSYQDGTSKYESDSQVAKISNSESFQKHLQNDMIFLQITRNGSKSDLVFLSNNIFVQQDVQNWITTSMEKQFEDFEFVKIGAVEMQGKKWLHVQWTAIAAKDYFLKGNKGSKIFFSEYFIPDPKAWLCSYFLSCSSSKWDEEVESCFEVISQTFLLKKPEVK